MAGQALSTIGVKFGWALGTMAKAPTAFKQIEECISIGGVELSKDKLDATPLESNKKKYVALIIECGCKLIDAKKALNWNTRKVVGCLISHEHG